MTNNETILFVCVENAARSQMAEAYFRKYAPKKFQAISAGTKPADSVNPTVIQVMKEVASILPLINQKLFLKKWLIMQKRL